MKNRYKVIKKEEVKKNDSILEIDLYLADEELLDFYVVHATKGLNTKKYIDGRIEDESINRFDAAISLVDYDIKFYDLLEKEFITSKLNKLVLKKDANVALRKPIYETSTKEELAYVEEENKEYKKLVKECRR